MSPRISVSGHHYQRLVDWGKPVVYDGRKAKRYAFESTAITSQHEWRYQDTFIVDDETGLTLYEETSRNGNRVYGSGPHCVCSPSSCALNQSPLARTQ